MPPPPPIRLLLASFTLVFACSSDPEARPPKVVSPSKVPVSTGLEAEEPVPPVARSGLEPLMREIVEESGLDGMLVVGHDALLSGSTLPDFYSAGRQAA